MGRMSKYNVECDGRAVREYLEAAYDVPESGPNGVGALIAKYEEPIASGRMMRSFAGYVGDKIAELEGLRENPYFDPDADDEDDDEQRRHRQLFGAGYAAAMRPQA